MKMSKLSVTVVLVIAFVQSGHSLQCWRCSSIQDSTCSDYFNVTRIRQNTRNSDTLTYGSSPVQPVKNYPHKEVCDDRYDNTYNQRNVCIKRVFLDSSDRKVVERGCRKVSRNLQVGKCPEELWAEPGRNIEYCGTCDSEECNSANGHLGNFFLTVVGPVLAHLLLRS
ncbi:unnamed protein product [Acanthoscelides obtectus]|uniref:Protein sleepless n=1 Tax=Acanthoscelides obtectus TaxID=200917 RepID=A0A9P0NU81_ACAOB|nr:unnamed protein product [Acanthoscelides obtectus]CAK1639722.1 hypothetical protein AOBTE_LOCUS11332 [Acanthoscelides obtectus]